MKRLSVLPMEFESCIKSFIEEKYCEHNLGAAFPNRLLREDVLDLLDKFCTVVYFPIENETNNGFHITKIPIANGEKKDFVFINTAQTMEKQVFTAAHELGHIWNVDDVVLEQMHITSTPEKSELIINRFAAVLLIPEKLFRESMISNFKNLRNQDGSITVLNMLKLIVLLMNHFFVPRKAVVFRMVELGYMGLDTASILLGYGSVSEKEITDSIQSIIMDYGFVKLINPSRKKWINGLTQLLEKAEEGKLIAHEKINQMRETFDLTAPKPIATEMTHLVPLSTQEGIDL